MNRPFWSRRTEPDPCASIKPLLALYADRMASPEEVRRVDAHLPGCERCRAALIWMQATHQALAARPVALPPADLHSRIAQAIAASSAAPPLTLSLLRPARSFTLRPAHAAAASLVVVGIALSATYSLWHTENAGVASPHPVSVAAALPAAKPHSAAALHSVLAHPAPSQIASIAPEDKPVVRPVVTPRKTASSSAMPRKQMANAALAPALPSAPVHLETVRHPAAVLHAQTASVNLSPEKRQPQAVRVLPAANPVIMPKAPDAPLVAAHQKEPLPVPVTVRPFMITPEAPPVQTASTASRPKPDDSMGKLADFAQKLRNAPYAPSRFTVRQASTGAASAVQALESEPVAYYGAIHSDTTIK